MAIDVAAWYEKYGPMLIRRCRALLRNDDEAMDALHDVFINLLKTKERLTDSFPSTLLYTIATNVCLNRLRARKTEKKDSLSGFFSEEFLFTDGSYDQVNAEMLRINIGARAALRFRW